MTEATAEPYRSELETLRAENERLRVELEALKKKNENDRPNMYPHSAWNASCVLCGTKTSATGLNGKSEAAVTTSLHHEPAVNHIPWYRRLFGAKATPERMRRNCIHCHGVYYEHLAPVKPAD